MADVVSSPSEIVKLEVCRDMTASTSDGFSPRSFSQPQVFRVPPRWLFVRVETAGGLVGWGEGTLEGHTETVEGAYEALREQFVGWDADRIQDIWQHAYRSKFYRGGPVLMVSSLEIRVVFF